MEEREREKGKTEKYKRKFLKTSLEQMKSILRMENIHFSFSRIFSLSLSFFPSLCISYSISFTILERREREGEKRNSKREREGERNKERNRARERNRPREKGLHSISSTFQTILITREDMFNECIFQNRFFFLFFRGKEMWIEYLMRETFFLLHFLSHSLSPSLCFFHQSNTIGKETECLIEPDLFFLSYRKSFFSFLSSFLR